MKNQLLLFLAFFLLQNSFAQDIRVYHGEGAQSVFLKKNDRIENSSREPVEIIRGVNGIVTIHILNPNPFFYNYEIKTTDVDIKDDYSDQFAEIVTLISNLPDVQKAFSQRATVRAMLAPTAFDSYQATLLVLAADIKLAKTYIKTSDNAETIDEALRRVSNSAGYGFRAAIAKIQQIPSGNFNSNTLEKDVNDMFDAAVNDGSFSTAFNFGANVALQNLYKDAFKALNSQLVTAVKEIRKVAEKDRIIRFQIPVKENKQTNVTLIVTKIKDSDIVARDLFSEEIAIVIPLYVRKRFEVVPVLNLVFQAHRVKYSVDNSIIAQLPDDEAKFNIGAMALMNFASFGDHKEYGVGFGVGYSMQPNGEANSIFGIPSLSYKNIVRFGFGFGYQLAPIGLKNGVVVGAALPANITNIEDVVDYKRKLAAVFTIAISGFKF